VVGDGGFRFTAASGGRHGDGCCRGGGRRGLHGLDGIASHARDDGRWHWVCDVVASDFVSGIRVAARGRVADFCACDGDVAGRCVGYRH
jgi:hypothetical protein